MQEIIVKVRYFTRGLSKILKKGNFNFSFASGPFQKSSFISYVLSDQV